MSKSRSRDLVRQGRELVKESKQLCDVSRERIDRGKLRAQMPASERVRHIMAASEPRERD